MAPPETPGSDSDYGYDFTSDEELQLIQLAAQAGARLSREASVAVGHESGHEAFRRGAPRGRGAHPAAAPAAPDAAQRFLPPAAVSGADVCYPDLRSALSKLGDDGAAARGDGQPEAVDDGRSPLQRFRSFPRKPLTVSDLTAGAWCELKHWYTLTRLPGGRRTRTAAMKQGSKVHRRLEDEIYTRVDVEVVSREDAFALRLWNLVQGLRTLRETGLTRELEVWGMVDGNVVNGVIDVVSHENPNPEFEEELSSQGSQRDAGQSELTDYFPPKREGHGASPKVYLTDVKTRASTAPVSTALLRPAMIQLLLYHRLLSDAAAGRLDLLAVFSRYGLDPDSQLSDAFLAQIGEVHEEVFYDAPSSPAELEGPPGGDAHVQGGDGSDAGAQPSSGAGLLTYRTLRDMSTLVCREIALAFPQGQASLGHMLHVQYRHRDDGRELDVHDFPVSRKALDDYLERCMGWWRGEREARGVDMEEAFKCRSCEFVADCAWRQAMDGERVRRAQRRLASRRGGAA